MDYKMTIAGLERHLPLCKVTDDLYIAGFIMFNDVEITEAAARELLKQAPEFDVLITAESKGIPLCYEMARQSGKPYIVARKGAKLYMQDVTMVQVKSITTSHTQMLCLGGDEMVGTYKIDGEKISVTLADGSYTYDMDGTIKDGIIELDFMQMSTLVFAQDGVDLSKYTSGESES